jgi:hypothetical protein
VVQLSWKIEFESLQINFGDFGRFWQKSNIHIFSIIWSRKMIPTLDHDKITYIWPFQIMYMRRTMLVHRLYRHFDWIYHFYICNTQFHRYSAFKCSVYHTLDEFMHILDCLMMYNWLPIVTVIQLHLFYIFESIYDILVNFN